MFSFSKNKLAN